MGGNGLPFSVCLRVDQPTAGEALRSGSALRLFLLIYINARFQPLDPPSLFFFFRDAGAADSKVRRVKKILVLGSGMVAEPLVEYLARYNSIHAVTIASHDLDAAKAIKARVKNTDATELNV